MPDDTGHKSPSLDNNVSAEARSETATMTPNNLKKFTDAAKKKFSSADNALPSDLEKRE